MPAGQTTRTAILSAMMRVAHLVLDGEPKIFSDPLALRLSGFETEAALMASVRRFVVALEADAGAECAAATFGYLRAGMAVRSRYAEDELGRAIQRGTAQYVILGAGLDSFPYRRRDLAALVRVFEVDLPATQTWKRERLRALGMPEPEGLVFVPLDLERQGLREGLLGAGYRIERPAFMSWLGTTQYLTTDAVFQTLGEAAALAPGSEIVFSYHVPRDTLDRRWRRVLDVLSARAAEGGAPWMSAFSPRELAAELGALGFTDVVDLGPEEALDRYFSERTDDLEAPRLSHLMKGRVSD